MPTLQEGLPPSCSIVHASSGERLLRMRHPQRQVDRHLNGLYAARRPHDGAPGAGPIDPAILPFSNKSEEYRCGGSPQPAREKKSGLLGISGITLDHTHSSKNEMTRHRKLAIRMFGYRVRHYVGAYLAILGQAEAVIFGGGIGEKHNRSACPGLRGAWCMGLTASTHISTRLFARAMPSLHTPESRLAAWTIHAEERHATRPRVAPWRHKLLVTRNAPLDQSPAPYRSAAGPATRHETIHCQSDQTAAAPPQTSLYLYAMKASSFLIRRGRGRIVSQTACAPALNSSASPAP